MSGWITDYSLVYYAVKVADLLPELTSSVESEIYAALH